MPLSVGIVGLPNVGKSTLFNALTRSKQANVANYPFCTIDPNVGVVEVPDQRLKNISEITKTPKIIPTVIEFVDIAGLVSGASRGEGLGNKFLSHIREVDAIVHVVRDFFDSNVVHAHSAINPKFDIEIVNLELGLADLATVSKRIDDLKHAVKNTDNKDAPRQLEICERIFQTLEQGKPARTLSFEPEEKKFVSELNLLTIKPTIYAVNVGENEIGKKREIIEENIPQIEISAKLESELADLEPDEAKAFLKESGIDQAGLDKLILTAYKLLDLITFFTFNPEETRAWTICRGAKAPEAAGVIHTDFQKGFIKADVADWQDFVQFGGWSKLKGTGKMRLEGKEYAVQDGDVIYFHVNT